MLGRFLPEFGAAYLFPGKLAGKALKVTNFEILTNPYECQIGWPIIRDGNPEELKFKIGIGGGGPTNSEDEIFIGRSQHCEDEVCSWIAGHVQNGEFLSMRTVGRT